MTFVDATAAAGDPMDWIPDATALMVARYRMTAQAIERLRRCKVIVRIGVGYDNIDLDAARARSIPVCNLPDYCIAEVADHALALALAQARALPFLDACVRQGVWEPSMPRQIPSFSVMKFGVLGYGRIGRSVLARARGFGFHLLACDPYLSESAFPPDVRRCALEELLTEADILSVHVPLTPETRQLLNAERLAAMKPTAILINTARGPVLDTQALAEALQTGRLGATGIDVFEKEPLPLDHPLLACSNALLTPHHAWYSRENEPKRYLMAIEEAIRGVRGEPLRSCVNGVQPNRT
jgi:D-3-phosphoglycerate dehydrogenase